MRPSVLASWGRFLFGTGPDIPSAGPILAYVLVNVPFLFFFYDPFNLNDSLYSTSLLPLGISAYSPQFGATITAGYQILPYNLVMFGAYWGLGFDLLSTAIALKLIAMAATVGSAFLIKRIAQRVRSTNVRALFFTFLFNPFLLFVNVVWVETDVLVASAILVAFYLFYFGWRLSGDVLRLLAGSTALLWATFVYFLPGILIPAFIVYSGSAQKQAKSLLVFAALGTLFAVPMFLLGLSPFTTLSPTSGGHADPYWFLTPFLVGYYALGSAPAIAIPFDGQVALLSIVAGIGIAVPVVGPRFRVHFALALLIVLASAFLLLADLILADNFVILVAIIPLALALGPRTSVSALRILGLELFLLPLLWIVQMFNGPGLVSGVYYWAYFVLHRDISLAQPLGGALAWETCVALYVALLVAALIWFVLRQRHGGATTEATIPAPPEAHQWAGPRVSGARGRIVAAACMSAILVGFPLAVGAATTSGTELVATDGFPSQLFMVQDHAPGASGVYLLPSASTYADPPSTAGVKIFSSSPPVGFTRALGGEGFSFNGSAAMDPPAALSPGAYIPVLNASGTTLFFGSMVGIPNSIPPLAPSAESNMIRHAGGNPILANVTQVFQTNGSGIRSYDLGGAVLNGTSTVFAALSIHPSVSQDLLWDISVSGTVVLESYLVGSTFFFGHLESTGWNSTPVTTSLQTGTWFYAGFSVGASDGSVTAWVQNYSLTLRHVWAPSGPVFLNLAKFDPAPQFDGTFSIIGEFTDLYRVPTSALTPHPGVFLSTPGALGPTFAGAALQASFDFGGTATTGILTVNGQSVRTPNGSQEIQFGKLTSSAVGLDFLFHHVELTSGGRSPALFWETLESTIALPSIPFVWLRALRGPRRPS